MAWLLKNGPQKLSWIKNSTAKALLDAGSVRRYFNWFREIGDGAPTNTAAPTISGTPTVGQVLTADPGTWDSASAYTTTYQWLADGVAISGATGKTRTLQAAQEGKKISVQVTATNLSGSGTATSAETAAVAPAP